MRQKYYYHHNKHTSFTYHLLKSGKIKKKKKCIKSLGGFHRILFFLSDNPLIILFDINETRHK
jgi:hypothetical protein